MPRFNREEKATIETAFSEYLNVIQDELMEQGFDEDTSQALIFASADKLRDRQKLPPFPVNEWDYDGLATWLVGADRINFRDFVTKTVTRSDG